MLHTIAPILYDVAIHELVFLGADRVRQVASIAHRNFLVPALFAHSMFAAERIETRERDVEVGQSHGDRRVAHVLREVGSRAQRQSDA